MAMRSGQRSAARQKKSMGNMKASSLLFGFCAGSLDNLLPALDLCSDESAELRGRAGLRRRRQVDQPLAQVRIGERLVELGVELLDDRIWRAHRRGQAEPRLHVEAWKARLGDGRHIRQQGR